MADQDQIPAAYDDPPVSGQVRRAMVRRRIMTAAIALAALGGFAALVLYAFDQGQEGGNESVAPVIKAEPGQIKTRPAQPGGMEIPNRDKQVFERLSEDGAPPTVERLLPPPEKPVMAPAPAPAPAEAEAGATTQTGAAGPENTGESAGGGTASPPARELPPVDKILTRPGDEAASQPAAPAKPEAAPTPAADPAPAAGNAWRIQLLSGRSQANALAAWGKLKQAHPAQLGRLSPNVVKADLGNKGVFYRLQAGPLADAGAARALCAVLKARKQGCIVVRP